MATHNTTTTYAIINHGEAYQIAQVALPSTVTANQTLSVYNLMTVPNKDDATCNGLALGSEAGINSTDTKYTKRQVRADDVYLIELQASEGHWVLSPVINNQGMTITATYVPNASTQISTIGAGGNAIFDGTSGSIERTYQPGPCTRNSSIITTSIGTETTDRFIRFYATAEHVTEVRYRDGNSIYRTDYLYGSGDLTLPTISHTGQTFRGWYNDASTKIGDAGDQVTFYWRAGGYDVYALWTNNVTIMYDGNGGTPSRSSDTTTMDSFVILPNVTRNATGSYRWRFDGWYDEDNNYVGDISDEYHPTRTNITLYANWTKMFDVTYNAAGGTAVSPVSVAEGNSITLGTTTRTTPSPGYVFNGWYNESNVRVGIQGASYTPTASISLHAVWTPYYRINYNGNGGTVSATYIDYICGTTDNLATATKSGATMQGWYTAATGGTRYGTSGATFNVPNNTTPSSTTLYAQWSNNVTITFNGNGGTAPSPITTTAADGIGSLPSSTRTGTNCYYSFLGWYTAAVGGTKVTASGTNPYKPQSNVTLYAHWQKYFRITYNGNGGTTPSAKDVNEGNSLNNFPSSTWTGAIPPSISGYRFDGWYATATGGTRVPTPYTPTANITLYAHWQPQVTISFDCAGYTNIPDMTVDASTTITLPDPIVAATVDHDYMCNGWFRDAALTDYIGLPGETYLVSTNQTIYARFIEVYHITYLGNGHGTPTRTDDTVNQYTSVSLPDCMSDDSDHWRMLGWGTTGTSGVNAGAVGASYTPTINTTLYAQWKQRYRVDFDTAGGAAVTTPVIVDAGGSITLPTTTRTNYRFDGWYVGNNRWEGTYTPTADTTITAHWTEKRTVAFNINGHGSQPASQTAAVGEAIALPTLSATGWTFQGWWSAATGGTLYGNGGSSYTIPGGAAGSTITMYAHWVKRYTITYKYQDGSTPDGTVSCDSGDDVTLPSAPSRAGYVCKGWWSAATGGTKIGNPGEVITPDDNTPTTIYMHWQGAYTVSFSANGVSATVPNSIQIESGTQIGTIVDPTGYQTSNYRFDGWYTTATGGTKVTSTWVPTSNCTLYAHWTNRYTITYNANGGSPTPSSVIVDADDSTNLPSNVSRSGYALTGWWDSPTGGNKVGNAADPYNPSGNITLYAQWVATRTVNFNANYTGGTNPASQTVPINNSIVLPNIIRSGYVIIGWYTAATGGTKVGDAGGTYTVTSNITLYAQWSAGVAISFDTNGGTACATINTTAAAGTTSLPTTTKTGYTFKGWYTDETWATRVTASASNPYKPSSSVELHARWALNITVTYNGNGGTVENAWGVTAPTITVNTNVIDGVTLPNLNHAAETGYYWSCDWWWTATTGGTYVGEYGDRYFPTASITLYAHWTKETWINFDWNDGSGDVTTDTGVVDRTITLPSRTRSRYILLGWYTAATGGTKVGDAGDSYTASIGTTLYAHWALATTVTFNSNGGSTPIPSSVVIPFGSDLSYALTALPTCTYSGRTLMGWSTTSAGDVNVTLSTLPGNVTSITYYAVWGYIITFDKNGGNNTPNPSTKTIKCGTAIGTLATCSRVGYTLLGWYTTSAATGGTQVTSTWVPTSNYTLYARWDKNVTISFNSQGGSACTPINTTASVGTTSLPVPTYSGYTFDGWYTAATGGTQVIASATVPYKPSSNVTLYAHWTQVQVKPGLNDGGFIENISYTNQPLYPYMAQIGFWNDFYSIDTISSSATSIVPYLSAATPMSRRKYVFMGDSHFYQSYVGSWVNGFSEGTMGPDISVFASGRNLAYSSYYPPRIAYNSIHGFCDDGEDPTLGITLSGTRIAVEDKIPNVFYFASIRSGNGWESSCDAHSTNDIAGSLGRHVTDAMNSVNCWLTNGTAPSNKLGNLILSTIGNVARQDWYNVSDGYTWDMHNGRLCVYYKGLEVSHFPKTYELHVPIIDSVTGENPALIMSLNCGENVAYTGYYNSSTFATSKFGYNKWQVDFGVAGDDSIITTSNYFSPVDPYTTINEYSGTIFPVNTTDSFGALDELARANYSDVFRDILDEYLFHSNPSANGSILNDLHELYIHTSRKLPPSMLNVGIICDPEIVERISAVPNIRPFLVMHLTDASFNRIMRDFVAQRSAKNGDYSCIGFNQTLVEDLTKEIGSNSRYTKYGPYSTDSMGMDPLVVPGMLETEEGFILSASVMCCLSGGSLIFYELWNDDRSSFDEYDTYIPGGPGGLPAMDECFWINNYLKGQGLGGSLHIY